MKRLFAGENPLYLLLLFVPVAAALGYLVHAAAILVFLSSALAIVPLAAIMGKATERIAARVGEGLGGLLNATFGNAAELIIALMALRAGLHDLVKASITGSIIGNILLVLGLSVMLGGIRYETQSFNRTAANLGSTMLVLSAIGLVVPAIFHRVAQGGSRAVERELSLEIAVVLIVTYVLSLIFTLKTHKHLYVGHSEPGRTPNTGGWSAGKSVGILMTATVLVAWMSEFLVGATKEAAEALGMHEVFVGVILVAIIGNAAEHSTAVMAARKNMMDLSINIAAGSSIQVALFVAPLLVFLSYFVGPSPIDLQFTTFEVVAVALSVATMALISQDGESNWMEGVQLLAVYFILALAFYFLPA